MEEGWPPKLVWPVLALSFPLLPGLQADHDLWGIVIGEGLIRCVGKLSMRH